MAFLPLSGNVNEPSGLQIVSDVLTNIARQYRPQGYVYDRICAPQAVNHAMGLYPIFDQGAFYTDGGNLQVEDRAPTPIIDFKWSTDNYHARNYRLSTVVTREELQQANDALRLEYSKTVGLLTVFATNRERRLAGKLLSTTNGGQLTSNGGAPIVPTVKWDAGTSTTPATIQSDLQSAALQVMKATGIRPNTLVIDYQVAYAIANDYTIKDLVKYLIGTQVVEDGIQAVLPPRLFGFNVVIADGTLYNTARPEDPASLSGVWGNKARLLYVNPNAQWGIPSVAYTFRAPVTGTAAQPPDTILPTGQAGQEPGPVGSWAIVDRWWEVDPPTTHIRVWERVDEKIVAPAAGVELDQVLANPVY
jgi:hypothetical protein